MSLLRLPFASLSARTRSLGRLLLLFLAINTSVRLVLALGWGGDPALRSWQLLPAMVIGAVFDIAIGVLALAPLAWLFAAWPRVRLGGALGLRRAAIAFVLPLSLLAAFTAAAEFAFWNEFGTRFNFIAVEYLVYGNEVIGNIRESYDLGVLLPAVGAAGLLIAWLAWRWALAPLVARTTNAAPFGRWRLALVAGLLAPLAFISACDVRLKEFSGNAQLDDIAGNGYFEFWHAFRNNEIDYARHYRTLPAARIVRADCSCMASRT